VKRKAESGAETKMPRIPGALTGCAGEHFVAYRLSAMGYLVALPRAGVPSVDLMVGTTDARNAVTIQVKTKNGAFSRATKKELACWYWQIGAKARESRGKSAFYAFVDLKSGEPSPSIPDVFIVPADFVAEMMSNPCPKGVKTDERTTWVGSWGKPPMYFFYIEADENRKEKEEKWWEAWDLIERALGVAKAGDGKRTP
jgi:hypothetical protein